MIKAGQMMLSGTGGGLGEEPPEDIWEIPSLWAFYEADSYSQADGSNITTDWTDLSGNGRHATVINTPTFETVEINGLPALGMSANSDDGFSLPDMSGLTAGSRIEVGLITPAGTNGGSKFGTSGSSSHQPYTPDTPDRFYDDFGSTVRKDAITPGVDITDWHVTYWWSEPNDWGMQQAGSNILTPITSNTVGFSATPKIWQNAAGAPIIGKLVAEYLFSAKLTAMQLAFMYDYISNKWDV